MQHMCFAIKAYREFYILKTLDLQSQPIYNNSLTLGQRSENTVLTTGMWFCPKRKQIN